MVVRSVVAWRLFWLAGVFASCAVPVRAQQFSADIVGLRDDGTATPMAKLRSRDGKVRIEAVEFPDGFFVSDSTSHVSYFARSRAHLFMEARQSSWLVSMFVPVEPSDPCRQWRGMAEVAGAKVADEHWRCERVGQETVGGRDLVRFRIAASPGREMSGWIDPALRFPVKIQRGDGAIASVANVVEGPQPPSLFEIPEGFRKFDPEALIRRVKQSDVWVEDPLP